MRVTNDFYIHVKNKKITKQINKLILIFRNFFIFIPIFLYNAIWFNFIKNKKYI